MFLHICLRIFFDLLFLKLLKIYIFFLNFFYLTFLWLSINIVISLILFYILFLNIIHFHSILVMIVFSTCVFHIWVRSFFDFPFLSLLIISTYYFNLVFLALLRLNWSSAIFYIFKEIILYSNIILLLFFEGCVFRFLDQLTLFLIILISFFQS